MINRYDKNGVQLSIDDIVMNIHTGECYHVVFAQDILAFGLENTHGEFEFMSEWVRNDWEVLY